MTKGDIVELMAWNLFLLLVNEKKPDGSPLWNHAECYDMVYGERDEEELRAG